MDNTNSTPSHELRRYLALAWHWTWLFVLVSALAAGTAYVLSVRMTPIYQASTTVLINEAPITNSADYAALVASERLAQTYSQMMTKQPVLVKVIERMQLNTTPGKLKNTIQVAPVKDTQLIEVKVENTNPQQAADIANVLVAEFSEQNRIQQESKFAASQQSLKAQLDQLATQIEGTSTKLAKLDDTAENKTERDRLETTIAQYRQTYAYMLQSYEQVLLVEAQTTSNIISVEPAVPPAVPIRPRTVANTLIAGMTGLLLAIGAVFLIEAMDDTLSPDEISRQLKLPVLGIVTRHDIEEKPVTSTQPRSAVSEAFRSLRTNIQFASVDHPIRTLLVTSPSPEDGKSTVAANLAVILAQSGREVVLVDADLRRPRVHKVFGLPNRQGISGLFVQPKLVLDGTLQSTQVPGLSAVTSGELPPNPAELLGSEKMSEIFQILLEEKDVLVIDTPPVLAVTDAAVLAPRVDGVILVVKPGTTKFMACKQAVDQLERVGARILGLVLNDVEVKRSGYKYAYYQGYYHTYHRYYGNDASPQKAKR
jgi:capsular exopolysaccharide synthesis family protein